MPFDPQWPQNGQLVDADRFREQFTSLKSLIDAIQGGGITGVQVDSVNTLPPGEAATVGLSLDGSTLRFNFGLPQGATGASGNNGSDGMQGPPGQTGQPFASAVVDAVNTLPAGSSASVEVSFDGSNVHFTFGIPQGSEGMAGSPGPAGSDGAAGAPGEVSQAQLDNAMGQTSNNSNAVGQMSISVDSSYNQSQMQAVFDKVDELILALRR